MALVTNISAYYNLNEASGNAADATGNGYTLTNTGTLTYASGLLSNGANFGTSNTTKYLTTSSLIGLATSTTDRTYSFWWKAKAIADGGQFTLFDHSYSTIKHELLVTYTRSGSTYSLNYVVNGSGTGGATITRTGQLTADTWYHIGWVRSSGVLYAYFNGASVSNTAISDTAGSTGLTDGFTVGTLLRSTTLATDGMMDEFGVWTRALSSGEITELYNGGVGLNYPFINFSGSDTSTVTDAQVTFVGTPLVLTDTTTVSDSFVLRRGWTNQTKSSTSWTNQTKN